MKRATVGFDVGNSSVKAGWFVDGHVEGIRNAPHHRSETIEEFVDIALADRPFDTAYVATVNKPASDQLLRVLDKRSVRVRQTFESDGSLFEEGDLISGVDTPKTTGVDRLLACAAALARSPERDAVVVTCGTAITLNLITKERVFQGGAILPGVGLSARSLHGGTAALPRITCPPPLEFMGDDADLAIPSLPGKSTISAMRAGVYFSAVGAIDRLIDELLSHSKSTPIVYITGGDAEWLCRSLRSEHLFVPSLVLEGLCAVVSGRSS